MNTLRIATYNIHKGVQGVGPVRRLEIHNLGHAVEQLDADIVCLQEVRKVHRREAQYFTRWPEQSQAEFLCPEGYVFAYETNAVTRHGEHGNALLSRWPIVDVRQEDISDHRFEQRGILHVQVSVHDVVVHVLVVHLGLIPQSRLRQVALLNAYIKRSIPDEAPVFVAGDFNDWGTQCGNGMKSAGFGCFSGPRLFTYPARLPLVQLDHIYGRHMKPVASSVPRGRIWWRMSDHLPLISEFEMPAGVSVPADTHE